MIEKLGIFILSMLAYIIAGRIGLLLSIPPGFASAVWPATGVALALALRFPLTSSVLGTAAGSFVINLAVASGDFSHVSIGGIVVAVVIGVAALLQTLVGYWLFRRYIGDFQELAAPLRITQFVLIVALPGYLVSCTISTAALWLSGAIPTNVLPFTWLTWWIGDSLGVLFFAPFLLTLMSPKSIIGNRQKVQILIPTLIIFIFTWIMFSSSLERQASENALRIETTASDLGQKVTERLERAEHILMAYHALIVSSPNYSREQFNRFSEVMLRQESALYGVGWTEVIPHAMRQQVEATFRNAGFNDFHFTQFSPEGKLIRAEEQPNYYPVLFIYPLEKNRRAFGLNLGANPARKAALLKSAELNRPVATAPIVLAQETEHQKATILYKPVFDDTTDDLLGYFSAVLRIEGILGEALTILQKTGFSIVLSDRTDPDDPAYLLQQRTPPLAGFDPYVVDTRFGERDYHIEIYANNQYALPGKDWTSWMVLTGGFLIAALTQMFVLAITGSHEHIRREVDVKTRVLQVQTELANSASKAKTEFLSNMSHELRTPLNAIIGLINLCLKTPLSAKQADYLDKARLASSTLLSLINQTLDHAKIEAGHMEPVDEPFSLTNTLRKLTAVFEFPVKEKNIELNLSIGEHVPAEVIGDELRVEQILINLLSNALKFTEQGSITLAVDYMEDGHFAFEVRDTGPGIPEEHQQTLFSVFSQGDSSTSRRFGGTGLGLSISKKLAQLMHGDVELVSTSSAGSRFRVTLPLKVSEASDYIPTQLDAIALNLQVNEPASKRDLKNASILVVEDTEINQMVAEELLSDMGAKITLADNGAHALDILHSDTDIQLVLMDIQMPIMDGFEATRRIRELKTRNHIPIIAMTANAMDQDVERCLQCGMNDHISKPIDADVLYNKLSKFITPDTNTPKPL